MKLTVKDIHLLNNIVIESDTIKLRELRDDDRDRVAEIAKAFAVVGTTILFGQYVKNPGEVEKTINEYDKHLLSVIPTFKYMKENPILPQEKNQQMRSVNGYIKAFFPDGLLFSPYGPIQAPFDKSAEKYINSAKSDREKPKRECFRMGIEYGKTLIGCFVFDFYDHTIGDKKATGDIGIFIDPEYRDITDDGRTTGSLKGKQWRETVYAAAIFFEHIFPLYYQDCETMYISRRTHPLNRETGRMFKDFTPMGKVDAKDIGREYADCSVIEYRKFFDTFGKKDNGYYPALAAWVRAGMFLLDTNQAGNAKIATENVLRTQR